MKKTARECMHIPPVVSALYYQPQTDIFRRQKNQGEYGSLSMVAAIYQNHQMSPWYRGLGCTKVTKPRAWSRTRIRPSFRLWAFGWPYPHASKATHPTLFSQAISVVSCPSDVNVNGVLFKTRLEYYLLFMVLYRGIQIMDDSVIRDRYLLMSRRRRPVVLGTNDFHDFSPFVSSMRSLVFISQVPLYRLVTSVGFEPTFPVLERLC